MRLGGVGRALAVIASDSNRQPALGRETASEYGRLSVAKRVPWTYWLAYVRALRRGGGRAPLGNLALSLARVRRRQSDVTRSHGWPPCTLAAIFF